MKFVHIADVHLDAPFTTISGIPELMQKRKLEQKEILKRIIDFIKENCVDNLFISGDLYEQENVKLSTIEYCNNLFKEIPNTKIWIAPGNHDPYIKNSYYQNFNWNENVIIFKNKIEIYEESDMNIYGYGFSDFYEKETVIKNIELKDKNKINILIIHGELDNNNPYNPMSTKELKDIGFDYIALGHIHNTNFDKKSKLIYPGSTMCLGFDEIGMHGMVVRRNYKRKI